MKTLLSLLLLLTLVGAAPAISFLPPTSPDGTNTSNSWTGINVSLNEGDLEEFSVSLDEEDIFFYDDSLVFYLNMDDNPDIGETSDSFVDISKKENNCSCSGAQCPVFLTGKYGYASSYDGSDDQMNCPEAVLDLDDEITIEAWIKAESSNEGAILRKWQWGDENGWTGFHFDLNGQSLQIVLGHGDGTGTSTSTPFNSYGQWTHVAATGTPDKIKVFVNGELLETELVKKEYAFENTRSLSVGGGSGWSGDMFEGGIDEIRVYNRALSPEEVKKRYQHYLKKVNSTNWIFYSNLTSLTDGSHDYHASASNSSGSFSTGTRTINVDLPQSIIDNLDASGFAGKNSEWDYAPFIKNPEGVQGSSNDSRISWDGVIATFEYSAPGDYYVELTFTPEFGKSFSGNALIRIVEERDWSDFPKLMWTSPVMDDGRGGNINEEKTAQAVFDLGGESITVGLSSEDRYTDMLYMLEQGQGSDLKVWARLPPGCEDYYGGNPCYPFEDDYVAWAEDLANLSLYYPQLEAWTVDDMHPHKTKFSSEYVRNMTLAAKRVNPNLRFVPTWYFHMEGVLFGYEEWEEVLDYTFMWYWASYTGSPDLEDLQDHLDTANHYIPPAEFVTGIYPMKEANEQYDEELTIDMLEMALDESNGIAVYNVPLWAHDLDYFHNATIFQQQTNDDPSFDYRLSSPGCRGTYIGWYQGLEKNISLPETIEEASISFDVRDSRPVGTTLGYHYKQLVVNGETLWDVDIVSDGTGTETITRDISPYLQGENSTIMIRMYDKKAVGCFSSSLYLRDINLLINGGTDPENWTFKSTIENISRFTETYDLVKSVLSEEDPCGNGVCDSWETHSNCPQDCEDDDDDDDDGSNGGNNNDGGSGVPGGGGGVPPKARYNLTHLLQNISEEDLSVASTYPDNDDALQAFGGLEGVLNDTLMVYDDCWVDVGIDHPGNGGTQIDVRIQCNTSHELSRLVAVIRIPKQLAAHSDNLTVSSSKSDVEIAVLDSDPAFAFYYYNTTLVNVSYSFFTSDYVNMDFVMAEWTQPWFFVALPVDAECGNGLLEEGEECDGSLGVSEGFKCSGCTLVALEPELECVDDGFCDGYEQELGCIDCIEPEPVPECVDDGFCSEEEKALNCFDCIEQKEEDNLFLILVASVLIALIVLLVVVLVFYQIRTSKKEA